MMIWIQSGCKVVHFFQAKGGGSEISPSRIQRISKAKNPNPE
jgi:hypothetical protein